MELMLPFSAVPSNIQIKHGDSLVLLGSCFADSMTEHFKNSGFNTLSNPFGTIFHPLALADNIEASINDDVHVEIHQRDDLFFSWDASSKIYGMSADELNQTIILTRQSFREYLQSAKVLVITFGTSWGYVHSSLNRVVANCHKERKDVFQKELSSVNDMVTRWKEIIVLLKEFNPDLQMIFSVSPVRHSKDGLVDNNRSKSRLIELTHELCKGSKVDYFPAYELVIDQLRDYRFFKRDMVHPSGIAVSHVWSFFQETYFLKETQSLTDRVNKINKSLDHKQLHPKSKSSAEHLKQSLESKVRVVEEHPEIYWK